MIPSNPNPPMSREEVKNFHAKMSRRMRGDYTLTERQQIRRIKQVYTDILKSNGGKNPLLGD